MKCQLEELLVLTEREQDCLLHVELHDILRNELADVEDRAHEFLEKFEDHSDAISKFLRDDDFSVARVKTHETSLTTMFSAIVIGFFLGFLIRRDERD